MRLEEALPVLNNACGKRFGDLFAGHPEDLRTNKGHVGQLLLRYIGLQLDSSLCDFDDGELKTNKSLPNGSPLETMWIRQIASEIDTLVGTPRVAFENSALYQKIRNLVYLPVVKQSKDPADWYFLRCVHVQVVASSVLFSRLEEDYNTICEGLIHHIANSPDHFIHTTNGHYLQVRSKDNKPGSYHPIYSRTFGRNISNKNHAFYFLKSFMRDAYSGKY